MIWVVLDGVKGAGKGVLDWPPSGTAATEEVRPDELHARRAVGLPLGPADAPGSGGGARPAARAGSSLGARRARAAGAGRCAPAAGFTAGGERLRPTAHTGRS